jgi:hypothetical protein
MRAHDLLQRVSLVAIAAAFAASCSKTGGGGGGSGAATNVMAVYTVPASLSDLSGSTYYDHPWPSDFRLENGSPRLDGFYNNTNNMIIDAYISSMKGLIDGFSPAGAGYLRFTGDLDPSSFPATPKDGLDPSASVQLLDITFGSPGYGQRQFVSLELLHTDAANPHYILPHTLAWMPTVGFPLLPHTQYALVLTDALRDTTGAALVQSPTVAELLGVAAPGAGTPDAPTSAYAATLASAAGEITKAGISLHHVVHFAVFTTSDPTQELLAMRDAVAKTIDPPTVEAGTWMVGSKTSDYVEYQARYGPSPNYQQGNLPFNNFGDGGNFVFQNGLPVVQSQFDLRFSLMVPDATKCPMPQNGYPIVLYAHGTGGDWRSYVQDGTGDAMARHCMATMGVDQIFQGTRPGSTPGQTETQIGITFYNFNNPVAARTNGRQSALDEVQRARLFTSSHMVVPSNISVTATDVLFDASQMMFFGHSQGGLNGPLFTAIDPTARGGVFSGSGAQIAIGLLDKTQPQAIGDTIRTLLQLNNSMEDLDVFHPCMSLFQDIIDVEDPLHYARLQATEARMGFEPKSIYMTEGINPNGTGDNYAPPPGIEAHALAMGLPLQLPDQHDIPQLAWGGPTPITVPTAGLSGNLAGGKASGILAQWAVPNGTDGHFVVFDVPAAQEQAAQFLENLSQKPKGLVPPP